MDVGIFSPLLSGQAALLRSSSSLGKSCRILAYTKPKPSILTNVSFQCLEWNLREVKKLLFPFG